MIMSQMQIHKSGCAAATGAEVSGKLVDAMVVTTTTKGYRQWS